MGMFEDMVRLWEQQKSAKPSPQIPQIQPIGYGSIPQQPAEMIDPRLQQEMLRDPSLEQRIRQYMIEKMRQQQVPQQYPQQNPASLAIRG